MIVIQSFLIPISFTVQMNFWFDFFNLLKNAFMYLLWAWRCLEYCAGYYKDRYGKMRTIYQASRPKDACGLEGKKRSEEA